MKVRTLLSASLGIVGSALALTSNAWALQPLQEFVAAARSQSFAAREQSATINQRAAEEDVAFGRLLPAFTARGTYTHNQYSANVQIPGSNKKLVIQPYNQFDASLLLEVPILDLANRARHQQATLLTDVAKLQRDLVGVDLDRAVTRLYTSYIGACAMLKSAEESIVSATKNYEFVQARVALGASTELDRVRALASLERAKQDRAEVELSQTLLARQLNTLTGLQPTPVTEFPEDALQPEAPLGQWLATQDTPADRMNVKLVETAEAGKRAANYALLPSLSATAQERFTNATGFTGRVSSYTLQAVLTWRLDYSTYVANDVQSAALELQKVRSEQTRRDLEDQIFEAYQRVQSGIVKSESARAQSAAAQQAAALASERYEAGAATQLDVTQAQRDAFLASAAQIQADADLAYSRTLLRINAGQFNTAQVAHARP